ncbi:hypothetical protein DBR32_15650, partial [Taibaiella sp. KBW10]|uniref:T9SS type A sorting domain-containing protein n=1 Tax=Taibaiella sp. KBW10 TaxID=2153357 RepID=UPI000F975ED0
DGSSKLSNIVILRLNTVQQDISLFPNPATQEVKVSGISEKAVLDIYSLDGRFLLQKALSATQAPIDVSPLPLEI